MIADGLQVTGCPGQSDSTPADRRHLDPAPRILAPHPHRTFANAPRPCYPPLIRRLGLATLLLASLFTPAHADEDRGARIRSFAQGWLGTPYLWGGSTRSGIDCSAFVREMYRELFGLELPRTTRQQIDLGMDRAINPRDLAQGMEPGDLIFYIDPTGVPNHVVTYAGLRLITHSVSGRGVVIEPIDKIYGRRVVGRRLLVPREGGAGYEPIPPAGPIIIREIPCPPSFKAKRSEVRLYSHKALPPLKDLGEREICDFRALASELEAHGSERAVTNAKALREHAQWLESIDSLKQTF